MLIDRNAKLLVAKVPIKDVYPDTNQGCNLKHAQTLRVVLHKNPDKDFPPLMCVRDASGKWMVKEGHHRYVACVADGRDEIWICWIVFPK